MKYTSKCKVATGILFACLLAMTQSIAAPKNQGKSEPPLGTWTQQGTDLNGDGVLSGSEDEQVFFFDGATTVSYTLQVEGECAAQPFTCVYSHGGGIGACRRGSGDYFEPGFKKRLHRGSDGHYGIDCDTCAGECAYTVTDVRP